MAERLEQASLLLKEAQMKIKELAQQRDSCISVVHGLRLLISSRMTVQQFDSRSVHKSFSQFRTQYAQQLSDFIKMFNDYEVKRTQCNNHFMYKIKLIRDQLTVKRLKLNQLKKKHEATVRQFATKEADLKKDAILRCIRCKARRKVIKSLECDVVQKAKRQEDSEKLIAKLTQENVRLKETLNSQSRDLIEIKSKLQDEINRNTARSNDPSLIVDGIRTPASGTSQSSLYTSFEEQPHYNCMNTASMAEDQARLDKELNRLQWLVNSKSAELVRVNAQLQEAQSRIEAINAESAVLRAELLTSCEELEVYKDSCTRFPQFVQQLELRDKQLQDVTAKLNSAHGQIDELKNKNEVLQTLLTNLATSVQTMLN